MSIVNKNVLVLNKYFMAVQVSTVQKAIKALVTGHARVVDDTYSTFDLHQWVKETFTRRDDKVEIAKYEGLVRSPSIQLLAPQVICFPDCEHSKPLIETVKYSRRNVYQRDKNVCQYCSKKFGKEHLTLDHVIPKSRGGKSSWANIVTCCTWCNGKKGDKLLKELGWKLKQQPKRPKWRSHVGIPFDQIKKEYWQRFLSQ